MGSVTALASAYRKLLDKFEERDCLDELQRPVADYAEEVQEHGGFTEAGATLSRADFEDARANL